MHECLHIVIPFSLDDLYLVKYLDILAVCTEACTVYLMDIVDMKNILSQFHPLYSNWLRVVSDIVICSSGCSGAIVK